MAYVLYDKTAGRPIKKVRKLPTADGTIPKDLDANLEFLEVVELAKPTFDPETHRLQSDNGQRKNGRWEIAYSKVALTDAEKLPRVKKKYAGYRQSGFTFAGKQFGYDIIPQYNGIMIGMQAGLPVAPRTVEALDGSIVTLATNDDITAFYATGFAYIDELYDLEHGEISQLDIPVEVNDGPA